MSRLKDFVAFRALLNLLEENKLMHKIDETYSACKREMQKPNAEIMNKVNDLYDLFTVDQISKKISEIVTPEDFEPEVEIIFQSLENLHTACPDHSGDWYFTGKFPTPGGNRVANRSFIYYVEGVAARAY
jgi:amidophosphoribosyltransferase